MKKFSRILSGPLWVYSERQEQPCLSSWMSYCTYTAMIYIYNCCGFVWGFFWWVVCWFWFEVGSFFGSFVFACLSVLFCFFNSKTHKTQEVLVLIYTHWLLLLLLPVNLPFRVKGGVLNVSQSKYVVLITSCVMCTAKCLLEVCFPWSKQARIRTGIFKIWTIRLEYLGHMAWQATQHRHWHIWRNIWYIPGFFKSILTLTHVTIETLI